MKQNIKVLFDSDALVALFKPDDSNHKEANKKLKMLLKNKAQFFVTNLVLQESTTVISHRMSMDYAKTFKEQLDKQNISLITISPKQEKQTWDLFLTQTKKGSSFIDMSNIIVYKDIKLDYLFSFDAVYRKFDI